MIYTQQQQPVVDGVAPVKKPNKNTRAIQQQQLRATAARKQKRIKIALWPANMCVKKPLLCACKEKYNKRIKQNGSKKSNWKVRKKKRIKETEKSS